MKNTKPLMLKETLFFKWSSELSKKKAENWLRFCVLRHQTHNSFEYFPFMLHSTFNLVLMRLNPVKPKIYETDIWRDKWQNTSKCKWKTLNIIWIFEEDERWKINFYFVQFKGMNYIEQMLRHLLLHWRSDLITLVIVNNNLKHTTIIYVNKRTQEILILRSFEFFIWMFGKAGFNLVIIL